MQKSLRSRDYRKFLKLLKAARREACLTQTHLAKRLAVTQSFVSKCERGEVAWTLSNFERGARPSEHHFPLS